MNLPLSLLDFCARYEGESADAALAGSIRLAQHAEAAGFHRVWYTEHHNMPSIVSSAPAVIMAAVGAHTSRIRLGSGGIMLPNHSPYTVAEAFGTLAHLYPGRIDLGVGRAPGTDQHTLGRALRRSHAAAAGFEADITELQAWLAPEGNTPVAGVRAIPGEGTEIPLYILGSSLFGATLAAQRGLGFGFASHFAPEHLEAASSYYRENFQPSAAQQQPYFLAGVNVVCAPTEAEAQQRFIRACQWRVARMLKISLQQAGEIMDSPPARAVIAMLRYTAVGTPQQVKDYLADFAHRYGADELIITVPASTREDAHESLTLLSATPEPGA